MIQEQAETTTVTLYPSHRAKVGRIMTALRIRKFSQAIQRMIDEWPEPDTNAEKPDTDQGASLAGNIGA